MPIEIAEDILQNNDFSLATDNSGDLVLEHKQTGGQFKFDQSENTWFPVDGLTLGGADINNIGNVNTNSADVTNNLTTGSATVNGTADVQALEAGSATIDGLTTGLEEGSGVSGTRTMDTVYQNTTGNDLFIGVEILNDTGGSATISSNLKVSRTSNVEDIDFVSSAVLTIPDGDRLPALTGVIPDGYYYEVSDFNNNATVFSWTEREVTRQ